jgi:acetoin utilization deacetylase AcuC-like enzyme
MPLVRRTASSAGDRLLQNGVGAFNEECMLPFSLVYHDGFYLPLGAHVFPGEKYGLIHERLLETGAATESDFARPEMVAMEDVLRVHDRGYIERLIDGTLSEKEILQMELPYSKTLVDATLLGCGGTLEAARLALRDGAACAIGGGFHHAHRDHGEGFCILHDVAIALARMRNDRAIERAMVIDLDVHDGNGTAAIFPPADEHRRGSSGSLRYGVASGSMMPSAEGVFTLSMHQQNNYPAYKPPSSLDVSLADGTDDAEYLEALERALDAAFAHFQPQLIAYVAGADPYAEDQLGGLALTIEGLKQRDRTVFRAAQLAGVPVFSVYAGGYARRVEDTVTIHANTVLAAAEIFSFHGATSC